MTQQEKAKAYDEAIERASKLKHDNAWVTTIFPELKESEDEKIRKAIIEHFKSMKKEFPGLTFGGYYYSNVFAYLERQKEQKPAEWCEEDERLLSKLEDFVDFECFDRYCNGVNLRNWLKSLRPQKHWKPSEEQMKALLNKLPPVQGMGTRVQCILEKLYDDLRKL